MAAMAAASPVATTRGAHALRSHHVACLAAADAAPCPRVPQEGGRKARACCTVTAAAGVALCVARFPRRKRGRGLSRKALEFVVSLPIPSPDDLQAAANSVSASASQTVSGTVGAAASLAANAGDLTSKLSSLTSGLPEELRGPVSDIVKTSSSVSKEAQEEIVKALVAALPPEATTILQTPALWQPAVLPAEVGAVLVGFLTLRRGPQRWKEELPRKYDPEWIAAYWRQRPLKLFSRFLESGLKIGYYTLCVYVDEWTGNLEKMRPERAVQARELITDLGVTFIKTAQLWASRPDILPEEYIKEYQKLLEQVRPFDKELAMQTLRRSKSDGASALELFEDLSVFEKPIAAASVGQVYKAYLGGRKVAVKVQRPDVREQSTLDLYVIRSACALGAYLPFERLARQCKQTADLVDLTAPTFIDELDYEAEASNQRRFATMVEGCDLIKGAVVVPEVIYSSQEVLVQEWLDGKKLTEPGAAQEQAGKVVKLLLNSYMVQFLETGYLHGDPHPGNFILMDNGKLGILDYGLMTSISSDKRLAFIEFLMHLQAKEYASCLQDLVNLEFFPAALAEDREAREVIVPTLASTLSTLYEEGGDLKKKAEAFKQQREEMKAAGKLDGLREQLMAISKKYSGAFKLPSYFTLILRAFATLEGLGLKTSENFAIVKECFPYIARRLITDDSFRMREALKSYLYRGRRRISVKRIDDLVDGFGSFTNLMKGSRSSAMRAGGPTVAEASHEGDSRSASSTDNATATLATRDVSIDTATLDIAEVVFSPDGNFLQDILIDEGVAAIDALSRATLVNLVQRLGPAALPISLPLGFLFGSGNSRILQREDKEALLVIRRITRLMQPGGHDRDADSSQSQSNIDLSSAVQDLQRLQPLAAGLLPTITPGAAAFARRFLAELGKRILLRSADDIERGSAMRRLVNA
eukprot:TRINITY_DN33223_c0_g1_i1.p1 TRINITY_DN33223_c0_g1~~TRINITY_DN33223_c0_g1_i1.p1  ORF type:complete len:929 (-),score=231.58 TRINITY_DN33223_c0_g1_i1:7-2793(-)